MGKIDINELLDDTFAEEMIRMTEKRISRRKRIKSVCVSGMVLLLSIGLLQHDQISRADEDAFFYAFGKNAKENMIEQKNKVFILKEPTTVAKGELAYTLQYAYLVEDELTVRIQAEKGEEVFDEMVLQCEGVNYFLGAEDTNCKNYIRGEHEVEVTIDGVTDPEFTMNYAGKRYKFVLKPTDGYTAFTLVTAKTGSYQASAMLLNRDKAVFGVHIDSPHTFSNWNVSIGKNPLRDKANVYFLGDNGIKYDGVRYYDANSFIPDVNQKETGKKTMPDFMCIRGVTYYKQFGKTGPSFIVELPEKGETLEMDEVIVADGIKIRILGVAATEDNKLRFKVSSISSGGHNGTVFQAKFSAFKQKKEDACVNFENNSVSELYIDGDKRYKEAGGKEIKRASYVYFYTELPMEMLLSSDINIQNANVKEIIVRLDYLELYINYPLIFRFRPELYDG